MVPHPSLIAARDVSELNGACNADTAIETYSSIGDNSFLDALQRLELLHNQHIEQLLQDNARLRASLQEPAEISPRLRDACVDADVTEPAHGITGESTHVRVSSKSSSGNVEETTSQELVHSSEFERGSSKHSASKESATRRKSISAAESIQEVKAMMKRAQTAGMKEDAGLRERIRWLMSKGMWFDLAIGVVISINALTIGIETQLTVDGQSLPVVLEIMEYLYLFVYMSEISLRLFAFGKAALTSQVQFDAFLVLCGIVEIVCKVIGSSLDVLEKALLLRIFRLARLARVLRSMARFRVLWLLVQGLMSSLMTITWTLVVILILLYIFAIVGMELIRPDPSAPDKYNALVIEYFDSVPGVMLTLLQVLTFDSIGSIYRPMIVAKPYLAVYFLSIVLFGSIALMNLVTAIMVDSSIQQASMDRDMQRSLETERKKKLIEKLYDLFLSLDTDGSGEVDIDEILSAPLEAQEMLHNITNTASDNELRQIFNTLDYDNSGSVGIGEFCEGLMRINDGKPLEIVSIQKQCNDIMVLLKLLAAHDGAPLTPKSPKGHHTIPHLNV